MNRRDLMKAGVAGALATGAVGAAAVGTGARANVPDELQDLWKDAAPLFSSGDPTSLKTKGVDAPGTDDRIKAFRIIANSPAGKSPYDVAEYYKGLKETGSGGPFNREWKPVYNPVIFGFLSMTFSAPFKGDETPWCAAFTNFCLLWSGLEGTQSHASASFRDWARSKSMGTDTPSRGDIVVFQNLDADGRPIWSGHVGFFDSLSKDGTTVTCLGGNQGGGSFHGGAITTDSYPVRRNPSGSRGGREVVGYVSVSKIPKTKI